MTDTPSPSPALQRALEMIDASVTESFRRLRLRAIPACKRRARGYSFSDDWSSLLCRFALWGQSEPTAPEKIVELTSRRFKSGSGRRYSNGWVSTRGALLAARYFRRFRQWPAADGVRP